MTLPSNFPQQFSVLGVPHGKSSKGSSIIERPSLTQSAGNHQDTAASIASPTIIGATACEVVRIMSVPIHSTSPCGIIVLRRSCYVGVWSLSSWTEFEYRSNVS